jgi:DNA-binding NarL/FixJ family response regulator
MVADRAATRLGIRIAVGDQVDICAEASDAEQAIRAAKRLQPRICLVGRAISGGLHAVRGICRAAPNSAVVVLADTADGDDMLECIRAGAIGYAPGALDGERLLRIIRAVEASEAVIPRSMVIELLLELRAGGGSREPLTGREAQVLRLLRHGHTTAAIAERLEVAPVTVRRHISGVVRKLGVADRATLTASLSRWGA